jgi:hypothetical protein
VADTAQCVLQYPGGVNLAWDGTLANSFGGVFEVIQGTDSALMLLGQRAWMIKEVDSPLLGWEVYARKEKLIDATGIALVANATKLLALGMDPAKAGTVDPNPPHYYALQEFAQCIRESKKPAAGAAEGLAATVSAIRANDAVTAGERVEIDKALLQPG